MYNEYIIRTYDDNGLVNETTIHDSDSDIYARVTDYEGSERTRNLHDSNDVQSALTNFALFLCTIINPEPEIRRVLDARAKEYYDKWELSE